MLHPAAILALALAAGVVPPRHHLSHSRPLAAGTAFTVDVGAARQPLRGLAPDDRPNQVADWAVIGALYRSNLPPDAIAKALYDKVPLRDPALEDVASFDYGPGRHVNFSGETWLFRPEADPHPAATVGRLADQARMELGAIPNQFALFTYRSDLARGQIQVTLQARVPGASLFRPAAGYVEKDVASTEDFEGWLASVDDVTYVSLLDGGKVRFGGRRFEDHRTPGATLDDVAALAHAQQEILDDRRNRPDPARVITAFNKALEAAKAGSWASASETLAGAEAELTRIDGVVRKPEPSLDPGSALAARFESLRDRIDHVRANWESYRAKLAAAHKPLPPEPGFSLDPTWDSRPLSHDLADLALRPRELAQKAVEIAKTSRGNPLDGDAVPIETQAAAEVASAMWAQLQRSGSSGWQPVLSPEQQQIVRRAMDLSRTGDVDGAGMVVFANAESWSMGASTPAASATVSQDLFGALTDFVVARSRIQCARYDGPLRGTHVGMVLFYTDLMAKVWGSVDYHRAAPVDDVAGFRSEPRISAAVEPVYWPEATKLRSTRLWFGPRKEGLSRSGDDRELYFGHVGTRLYAAGSDPLHPHAESRPAEASRRVVTWWDRHYAEVADYEPQYHVQNQIMKWSVITGVLAAHEQLGELGGRQPVDRSNRFDRWFSSTEGLRFRDEVRLLPEDRWVSDTECMEILASHRFKANGGSWTISGGVSLGAAKTVESRAVLPEVDAAVRHAGLDSSAGPGVLRNLRGVQYTVGKPALPGEPLAVQVQLPKEAVLRSGGLELSGSQSMELDFATPRDGPASVGLKLGREPLGNLEVAQARGGSVALEWRDGAGMAKRDLAGQLADSPPGAAQVKVPTSFQEVFLQQKGGRLQAFAREPSGEVLAFSDAKVGSDTTLTTVGRQTGNRISVAPVDEAEVHQALSSSRWQQVRLQGTGSRQSLATLFTDQGPPPGARRFSVAGEGGQPLQGFTDGQRLYFERPAGPPGTQVAFDNLVPGRQLTPGQARVALAADPAQALSEGNSSPAARDFLAARPEEADARLSGVLDQLNRRDLSGAAKSANAMFPLAKGGPVPMGLDLSGSGPDAEAVGAKLQAATLPPRALLESALGGLSMVEDGHALASQAELNRPLAVRRLSPAEAQEVARLVAEGKAAAYVPDQGLLAQKDWDFSPRQSFSDAAKDPRVEWEAFDETELAGLAPDKVREIGGQTFTRRSGAWGPPVAASLAGSAAGGAAGGAAALGMVYLLHLSNPSNRDRCDWNGDGKVSPEELRRCCDRDGDGKVSQEERRHCK